MRLFRLPRFALPLLATLAAAPAARAAAPAAPAIFEDDYAGALAAARAREVPLVIETWAPW